MTDHLHQWIIDFKRTKIKGSRWHYENVGILLNTPASWQHCQHQNKCRNQHQHQQEHQDININTEINIKLVSSNTSYRQELKSYRLLGYWIYDKVSDVEKVESDLPAKIWRLVGCTKIDRWCISFPNMYDKLWAKVDRLAGKTLNNI